MAKYLIEDTTLTEIANAIRSSGITTNTMKVSNFHHLIGSIKNYVMESIPQLPSGITALDSGTFTPASDVTTASNYPHNLGVAPNFFLLSAEGESVSHTDFKLCISHEFGVVQRFTGTNSGAVFRIIRYSNGTAFQQFANTITAPAYNASTFQIYASSTYSLKAGVTYRWIAGVLEGI